MDALFTFLSLPLETLYLSVQRIKHPPFLLLITQRPLSPILNCLLAHLVTHPMFSGLALNTTCTLVLIRTGLSNSATSPQFSCHLLETCPWHSTTPNSTCVHNEQSLNGEKSQEFLNLGKINQRLSSKS